MAEEVQDGNGRSGRADKGHRTSLATRLAVVILLVSITSILITVLVSSNTVGGNADELIDQRVVTRANSLASELNLFFEGVQQDVQLLALSPSMVEALDAFSGAYDELAATDPESLDDEEERLFVFYSEDFAPALADVRGGQLDPAELLPRSEPAPTYLQAVYIADAPVDAAERRLITDPGDGSAWTDVHKVHHPAIRNRIDNLDLDDLFLIDAESKSVVYSTNKDIAFGTNIVSGPHSGTPLAALARRVLANGEEGAVFASDFATYTPLLDLPSGFLATPLFDNGQLVGVLAVAVDIDDVSTIMSEDWMDGRFGETGESYLVGSDRTMRSDSRFFIENPASYLLRIAELGNVSDDDRRHIEKLGTTVVFQPVDNESVRAGLDGESEVVEVTNYLGDEVFSAHAPIAPEVFDWVLIVEQSVEEASTPFSEFLRSILTVTVVFVVGLTFFAVAWAGQFVAPLRSMGAALRATREDDVVTPVPVIGVIEFRNLAGHLNDMVESLVTRRESVLKALRGKTAVLRTLLPASAIAQVTVGDRQFVETVPQATVAVIRMDGIETLFASGDVDTHRQFLTSLIREADDAAKANDLERVKVTGAAFYAVSGLDTPHLDHAPRAVRFAAETIQAMDSLAAEAGVELSVSAGVSTGTITAGLVGDSRLVFDLWGEPVDDAATLAHVSPPDTIYVSAGVRQRLPGGTGLRQVQLPHDEVAWSVTPEIAVAGSGS